MICFFHWFITDTEVGLCFFKGCFYSICTGIIYNYIVYFWGSPGPLWKVFFFHLVSFQCLHCSGNFFVFLFNWSQVSVPAHFAMESSVLLFFFFFGGGGGPQKPMYFTWPEMHFYLPPGVKLILLLIYNGIFSFLFCFVFWRGGG